jgi:predicted Zn-dependent protease with MMP-like domain
MFRKTSSERSIPPTVWAPPWPFRGTPESIRKIIEDALQTVGKDPNFRKEWEDVVLEGNSFEQMFTGKEVSEDVQLYTDWRPEIISMYKRLAYEAAK